MALRLENVSIQLSGRPLIQPLSLDIEPGETVTLMGVSGSGKSTLLSHVAGDLEPPFTAMGQVSLDGVALDGLPPEKRRIGRLFQDDLLFPHLTVAENLLFGMPRGPRPERLAKVAAALAEAGLLGFGDRPPNTLSGGQRARVALMRALVAEPRAMLLDEPFSKLDADLRQTMRSFVFEHIAARRIPCLMVTHDKADAPQSGRVLLLREGRVNHA
ncbi:ATP-binding cassette domain-containing protein [Aestuariivirga sp.]|uniref:ATP-binding cassette domain-containing protein n=1 Tax=Aestuariivirga sp. TaxID=2650926 RepID=UPI0025C5BE74|nr:ATP-binding cassette domain-containing protein [Aestuariivirga sp.]MCA3555371.1 ATP-binding cassette domain-containing protein [Aestuariivirga sp.]